MKRQFSEEELPLARCHMKVVKPFQKSKESETILRYDFGYYMGKDLKD